MGDKEEGAPCAPQYCTASTRATVAVAAGSLLLLLVVTLLLTGLPIAVGGAVVSPAAAIWGDTKGRLLAALHPAENCLLPDCTLTSGFAVPFTGLRVSGFRFQGPIIIPLINHNRRNADG